MAKRARSANYAHLSEARDLPTVYPGFRSIEPLPDSFIDALHAAAWLPPDGSLADLAAKTRSSIQIDRSLFF